MCIRDSSGINQLIHKVPRPVACMRAGTSGDKTISYWLTTSGGTLVASLAHAERASRTPARSPRFLMSDSAFPKRESDNRNPLPSLGVPDATVFEKHPHSEPESDHEADEEIAGDHT